MPIAGPGCRDAARVCRLVGERHGVTIASLLVRITSTTTNQHHDDGQAGGSARQ